MTGKKPPPSRSRKTPAERPPGKAGRRIIRGIVWTTVVVFLAGAGAMVGVYLHVSRDLPKISTLADYRPPVVSTAYAADGRKIAEFYKERRIVVPLAKIPKQLVQAFVAAEDARFYSHRGIDLPSIVRAFFKNLEAGTIVQGGSTITQQVTKSFLLTPERSYERKLKEAILAYRIDKTFSKEDILFLYLNQIYLGHGAYGVAAAAENYFGKPVSELDLAESAMLAGLPQAPSRYSPFRNPKRAEERQRYVLNRMLREGYITSEEAAAAANRDLDIHPRKNWYMDEVPFYTEHVRRQIEARYGAEALYTGGLQIHTAVDVGMQKTARQEIEAGLRALDKRQGYRGPLMRVHPEKIEAFAADLQMEADADPPAPGRIVRGVVTGVDDAAGKVQVLTGAGPGVIALADMRWARKPNPDVPYYAVRINRPGRALRVGDVVEVRLKEKSDASGPWALALEQEPIAQAALLCIEAATGEVKAMVGGKDFSESQFNRAVQSRRQPGSAFKPIIYAAAIDKGYTPATVIVDSPIVFSDTERDFTWKPKNYKERFHGPTLLRQALAKSRNVVTIKILQDIGVDYLIDYARKMGITSTLNRDLSIALGSSGVSLLELTNAYSVFANQGYRVEPVFVRKIVDRDGNVLQEPTPLREKVIDQSTAYIMTSLLEGVVQHGTGRRVRALNRPAAGKTGTTNNLFDAWFMGFTPRYITGTWVGFDEERSLGEGETGSRAASPIWLGFMKQVLEGKPIRVFEAPEGIVFAKIDAKTGLLPIRESEQTIFECFKEGTVPTERTPKPGTISEPDQFFKSLM